MTDWRQQYGQNEPPSPNPRIRAAVYVRMSTEHQKYSTENQGDAIHRYAAERHIDVVKTYADEGKSGLRLDGGMPSNCCLVMSKTGGPIMR